MLYKVGSSLDWMLRVDRPGAKGVPRDGPGRWYVPQTAGNFTALGLAVPNYLWLCQEASGSLSSATGTLALAENATGHLYAQTVTGWSRKFVGTDGATAGQGWRTTDALLDLADGQSCAMVAYCSWADPAAARTLFSISGANDRAVAGAATIVRSSHNGVVANGAQAHADLAVVRQVAWYRNATTNASGTVTNLEAIAGTHNEGVRTGTVKSLGDAAAATPPSARYCWFAIYLSANAEQDWAAYLTTLRGV